MVTGILLATTLPRFILLCFLKFHGFFKFRFRFYVISIFLTLRKCRDICWRFSICFILLTFIFLPFSTNSRTNKFFSFFTFIFQRFQSSTTKTLGSFSFTWFICTWRTICLNPSRSSIFGFRTFKPMMKSTFVHILEFTMFILSTFFHLFQTRIIIRNFT